jgi:hypothetical protein
LPGAGSLAPRLIKPLCRRGKLGLEAEYLARRRQHGSKTDQTFMQEGKNRTGGRISCPAPAAWLPDWSNLYAVTVEKNWRQNILPGVSSLAPRLIKPLCRRGKIGLEAEYLAWRRQHGSQTD